MKLKPDDSGVVATLRRDFMISICAAAGGLVTLILAIPFIGFLLAPLLRNVQRQWRSVGPVGNFKPGDMVLVSIADPSPLPWSGLEAKSAAYVRRIDENRWQAFSIHCTHLGCPVRWLKEAEMFMCPCHGGVYYADGSVAAGPPPRHLVHIETRERDGQLELLTTPVPIT